jgi:thiamine transport system ATP-binding protein
MLQLTNVTVRFGATVAVDDVTLRVSDGEQVSVLGPSGSGKSTLLRAIAGLEPLASGQVAWDGRDLADLPTHRRGFGLMFQDYVLFPHLDVAANIAFGLEATGVSRDERTQRVAESLELVGLSGYQARLPAQLSGGEQQRVALARALAPRPRLLMLDEPLGALDRGLRRSLLDELAAIFERLSMPIIYVTHDHEEALAIGDRVAVMRAGRIETVMPPGELWQRPPSEFVARFLGLCNVLEAHIVNGRARTEIGTFTVPADAILEEGSRRKLLLRPEAFVPASNGEIDAVVRSIAFRGDHTLLKVDVMNGGEPVSRLELEARWQPIPRAGERLRLAVDPSSVLLLPLP